MKETERAQADVEHVMNQMIKDSPELQDLFSPDDPKFKFPAEYGGLHWHYFSLKVGRREYMYGYTTTKNANKKFLSWTYKPYYKVVRDDKGKYHKVQAWSITAVRETRRYKSAKDRAFKKYDSHRRKIEQAALRRSQKSTEIKVEFPTDKGPSDFPPAVSPTAQV